MLTHDEKNMPAFNYLLIRVLRCYYMHHAHFHKCDELLIKHEMFIIRDLN